MFPRMAENSREPSPGYRQSSYSRDCNRPPQNLRDTEPSATRECRTLGLSCEAARESPRTVPSDEAPLLFPEQPLQLAS